MKNKYSNISLEQIEEIALKSIETNNNKRQFVLYTENEELIQMLHKAVLEELGNKFDKLNENTTTNNVEIPNITIENLQKAYEILEKQNIPKKKFDFGKHKDIVKEIFNQNKSNK